MRVTGVTAARWGHACPSGATPHRSTTVIGCRHNLPSRDPSSLIEEVVKIGPIGPHDLLAEVKAVSVNPVDVKVRAGYPTSDLRVLRFDAAGTVLEVGTEVTLFAPGDDVFYAGSIARPGANQHQSMGTIGSSADNTLDERFNAALKREPLEGRPAFLNQASTHGPGSGVRTVPTPAAAPRSTTSP